MKVNPFKTTLYSSVLLAGLAATSVAAADEAKDVTATTDTDATVSNTAAESSANLVKTTGDAAVSTGTDIFSANVTVNNTLQDAMKSNTSDSTGFTTLESTEKTSILPDKIDLSKEKVAVFKAK